MFGQAPEGAYWHSLEIVLLFNLFWVVEYSLPLSLLSHSTLRLEAEIVIVIVF